MARRPRSETKPKTAPRKRAGSGLPGAGRAPLVRGPRPLLYKVVELSTVDEGALERTLNEWSQKGWNLDGVQFAMREASKRPAMAFVFFTREGEPEPEEAAPEETGTPEKLARFARRPDEDGRRNVDVDHRSSDPWQRLRELAEGGDEPDEGSS